MKSYTLPVAKQVLNHLITNVTITQVRWEPADGSFQIDLSLYDSAVEENPSFKTTVLLTNSEAVAVGLNAAVLLTKVRAQLNI